MLGLANLIKRRDNASTIARRDADVRRVRELSDALAEQRKAIERGTTLPRPYAEVIAKWANHEHRNAITIGLRSE